MNLKTAYIAFDIYPSAKGAATHISHFAKALFEEYQGGHLFVLANEKFPLFQDEGNVKIHRFLPSEPNYLKRAQQFTDWLIEKLENLPEIELIHFRDIWGGLAAFNLNRKVKTIFEVNSFTSIELPYKYKLSETTLSKIREYELFCLQNANEIIVPSQVIKENLTSLSIPSTKVKLISNGADLVEQKEKPQEAPEKYILYFGALQAWQGVDILLKAFEGLQDFDDLKLVIISSNREKFSKPYKKLAEKLDINTNILWYHQLQKEELQSWISNAYLTVAPLIETARNLEQGCSPLKIFESMAAQTSVVASDLPVVREIIVGNENGKLVRPNRPADLSRAIRFLLDFPQENQRLALNAYQTIKENFLWQKKTDELKGIYKKLL